MMSTGGLRNSLNARRLVAAFALGLAAGAGFSGTLPVGAQPPGPIQKDKGPVAVPLSLAAPDLIVTIADLPDPIGGGSKVAYTLKVSNIGTKGAAPVVVRHTLPAGATFVRATAPPPWHCSHASGVVTCSAAGQSPGQTTHINVVSKAPSGPGSLVYTAVVQPIPREISAINNTATVTRTNAGPADLKPNGFGTPWRISEDPLSDERCLLLGLLAPTCQRVTAHATRGVTLRVWVKNQGPGPARATTLRLGISATGVARFMRDDEVCPQGTRFLNGKCLYENRLLACSLSQAQERVATCSIPSLAAGATSEVFAVSAVLLLQQQNVSNVHITFLVGADDGNLVEESNEFNNLLPTTVIVF